MGPVEPQPLARRYSRHRRHLRLPSGGCQPAFPSTPPQFPSVYGKSPFSVVLESGAKNKTGPFLARCSGQATRWRQSLASEGRRPEMI